VSYAFLFIKSSFFHVNPFKNSLWLYSFFVNTAPMLPNVSGWRRFFAPDMRNRAAVSRAQKNVSEQNATKGVRAPSARPAGVLRTPQAALLAAGALTVCYMPFCFSTNYR
jgi:hypothetical protein